ncbi:MAG TPA: ion transporter, partial [Gammaproteobacteria bacterium]|nr:ion transporter [Gammaproteobacteria bacterium]
MRASTLNSAIGLSGVAADETPRAQRWARFFEAPMILLAVWI